MTRLGSTFVSDDPDSRGTEGPTGQDGPVGPVGNVPLTTKGDIMSFDTDDARLPVGANDQVLTADSAQALGVKWATPAAGGADAASINGVIPGTNFLMCGEIAASDGTISDGSVPENNVRLDFIFFPTQTTISEVSVRSATASNGGTIIVGLHPMVDRVSLTTQDFVASITISTVLNTTHVDVLGTPWVVPAGWYALVTYNDTAANITNIISRQGQADSGGGGGKFYSGIFNIGVTSNQETENKTIFLFTDNYATTPDLTAIDFNDGSKYVLNATSEGLLGISGRVPIVYLKVTSA